MRSRPLSPMVKPMAVRNYQFVTAKTRSITAGQCALTTLFGAGQKVSALQDPTSGSCRPHHLPKWCSCSVNESVTERAGLPILYSGFAKGCHQLFMIKEFRLAHCHVY